MNDTKRKLIILSSVLMLFMLIVLDNFTPINNSPMVNINHETNIESADITENDLYSGLGQNINSTQFAQCSNNSQTIPTFDSTSSSNGYIDLPPEWTAYRLFTNISSLYDNNTWLRNGNLDNSSYWTYQESTDEYNNNNGSDTRENMWGYYAGGPGYRPSGTESGSLFIHQGYIHDGSNDAASSNDYAQFYQTIYINRSSITDAKLSFYYWTNSSDHGISYMYGDINGYRKRYYEFETGKQHHNWLYTEFSIPVEQISSYMTGPQNIDISLGIRCSLNAGIETVDGYVYAESYFDNITLWIRGKANPNQIELKINDTSVTPSGYGLGNLTLTGSWSNPSSISFNPVINRFTTNSTGVSLIANMTIYANKTKYSQDSNGNPFSEFSVEHGKDANWTVYYYSLIPDGYTNYNFTIYYPNDWDAWAAYNPTPTYVLGTSGITESTGSIAVETTPASVKSGTWKFEFNSHNYVTDLKVYKNTTSTPGPTDWIETNEIFSGDLLNVTAKIKTDGLIPNLKDTIATLTIKFPETGQIWSSQIQYKNVSDNSNGMVYFDPIQIPTSGADYFKGQYTILVSWNNSIDGIGLTEVGVRKSTIFVKHYSRLTSQQTTFMNFIEGTSRIIEVNFNDEGDNSAIRSALVYFVNLTGQTQYLSETSPGVYATIINAPNINPGINVVTLYANHTDFNNITLEFTFEVIIKTNIAATEYPSVSTVWNVNVSIHLDFTEFTSTNGITDAMVSSDWVGESWIEKELTDGWYTLHLNTSAYPANTQQKVQISLSKQYYQSASIQISVEIGFRDSDLKLYLNGEDKTISRSLEVPYLTTIDIEVDYFDVLNSSTLLSAIVNLTGVTPQPIQLVYTGSRYYYELDTSLLGVGEFSLGISATSSHNSPISLLMTIKITSRATDYRLYLQSIDKTLLRTITEPAKTNIEVGVDYYDSLGTILLANVILQGIGMSDIPLSYEGGLYKYTFDSSALGLGTHTLTIIAAKPNYDQVSFTFEVVVTSRPTSYQLFINNTESLDRKYSTPLDYHINFSVNYIDTLTSSTIPNSISVYIQGIGSGNTALTYSNGIYQLILDTSIMSIDIFSLTVIASENEYDQQNFVITLTIENKSTDYTLQLNNVDKTIARSSDIDYNEILNIKFDYFNPLNGMTITDSSTKVILKGFGSSDEELTFSAGWYQYDLDTSGLSLGVHSFLITASADNFTLISIQINVNVIRRTSSYILFINETDRTTLRTYTVPIRGLLNISVNYYDQLTSGTVIGANVVLKGMGTDKPFGFDNGLYNLMINSSDLGLGTHYLTVICTEDFHSSVSILITITVIRIPTIIKTPTEETTLNYEYTVDNFIIAINLTDTLYNTLIYDATVTYTASFGTGTLTDPDHDGIYTATINNPGIGTHTIQISVYKGNEYRFDSFQIVVNIIDTREPIPKWIMLLLIAVTIALLGLFVAYQLHFKYPKVIRKVRKVRKNIRIDKLIQVPINSQELLLADKFYALTKETLPKLQLKKVKSTEIRDTKEIEIEQPEETKMVEEVKKEMPEKKIEEIKKPVELKKPEELKKQSLSEEIKKISPEPQPEIGIKAPEKKDFSGFKKPEVKELPSKPQPKSSNEPLIIIPSPQPEKMDEKLGKKSTESKEEIPKPEIPTPDLPKPELPIPKSKKGEDKPSEPKLSIPRSTIEPTDEIKAKKSKKTTEKK